MALLIHAHGARLLVREGAPDVVYRSLRASLPSGMATEVAEAEAEMRYEVSAEVPGGPYRIVRDGAVVDRARDVRGLCRRLRNHVEFDLAVRARTAQFVHAGVVAWRGKAILIPGSSNAGKTTLVAALVRRGATCYSDEYAVIDEAGKVHPYLRRSGRERMLLGAAPTPPIQPALVLATTYVPGARWAPVVLEGARAALPLLDHLLTMRDEPRRALRLAARLGPRLIALQGPRPDAAEVAPAVLEFVDRILDGAGPQAALADSSRSPTRPVRPAHVIEDPSWVPVAVTGRKRRVRFRRLERPFYIAHAGKRPRPGDVEIPLAQVEAVADGLRDPAKVIYVYHHGYAGSTLLFRLLDAPRICLAYAEPSLHFHRYADAPLRRLCNRTFHDGETPLIKTVPAEIRNGKQHFADHPESRALFLYAQPEQYVAATLFHDYRREYVTTMARNFGAEECAGPAEAAVYCWERIAKEAAALAADHPLKAIEADIFFSAPGRWLEEIWTWLGFPARDDWSEALARVGSIHSKNGRPFTQSDRRSMMRAHAERARPWLDAHGEMLATARETLEDLARFRL